MQVGPDRINRAFTSGQHRHEILIRQNDSWRQVKLLIIIRYQGYSGLRTRLKQSGMLREKSR
jgi:hypothetical protein